ncbi:MAG: endopeptidase La [Oligoflexales bacterium]|nr:endopeptidase La [Oligoflexales bacterium]
MAYDLNERSEETKIVIPLLPLRDILVFPSTVVPLFVGRQKSILALDQAMMGDKKILLAAQKNAKIDDPSSSEIFTTGTIANILQLLKLPDGSVKVLVEGYKRAKITRFLDEASDYHCVEVEYSEELPSGGVENEALVRTVKQAFDNYVRLNKRIPPEMLLSIAQVEDESKLADTLVAHLSSLKLADKQAMLEELDPKKRLETIYGFIQSEIEIIRVEKKIRARVKRQMEKTQKEYYLNEQMAAIQKELGEREDGRGELVEIEKLIKKKKLSKEAREKVNKELKKLKSMSPMAAEATVVRNYIDTVLSLPWGEFSKEITDVNYAEEILDRDHYGLTKVKDRILEYLSINSLVEEVKGPIMCLVGPPGVGKTSLAKSIAEATGRSFVRIALGGVRDEAEIRGHRRTYIGSMPGKIIQAIKKAETSNPLILLDEIDKLSADYRGDPSSALLEVLDPAQNHTFNDHYLDLDFDLSHCLFFATANTAHTIPRPLMDRMELISLSGYTEQEKAEIAKNYLVPKALKDNGLNPEDLIFSPGAVKELIRFYTREAGVRNLEREISSVLRKVARRHLSRHNKEFPTPSPELAKSKIVEIPKTSAHEAVAVDGSSTYRKPVVKNVIIKEKINEKSIQKYLGAQRYRIGLQETHDQVGICTGLAWTEVGGDLLSVEVAVLPGKGKVTVTGKLGEVMQESVQAANSYVRSRSTFLGLAEDYYQKIDLHIHVPEGAIPKDGPSAGICMATAITSAVTGRPVSRNVAMTGEITLRGHCLAIGGLKEKVLAAHRGGITKILFPKENLKDVQDIPKSVLADVKMVAVEHMDEVLLHALAWSFDEKVSKVQDELFDRLKDVSKLNIDIFSEINIAH